MNVVRYKRIQDIIQQKRKTRNEIWTPQVVIVQERRKESLVNKIRILVSHRILNTLQMNYNLNT